MDGRTAEAEPGDVDDVFDSYMQSSRPSVAGLDDDSGADSRQRLRRHSSDAIMEHQGAASTPPRRTRRHSADAIMQKSPEAMVRRLQLEPSSCASLGAAGLWRKALDSVGKSQRTSCPVAGGAEAPSAAGRKCRAALLRAVGDMGRRSRLDADARRYGGSGIDFTADADDDSAQMPGMSMHAHRHNMHHSSAQNGCLSGAPRRRRTVSSPDVLAAHGKMGVQGRGSSPRKHEEELPQEHEEIVSIPIFHVHPSHPDFVPPVRELHLPSNSAYTLAVLGPMLLPWHRPSDAPWHTPSRSYAHTAWIVFQRSYFVLVCAWCLQLGMLNMLVSEISDSGECAPTGAVHYWLKLAYISFYTGYILTGVTEAVSMFEWIHHAPNATEVSTIELRRTVKRSSRQVRSAGWNSALDAGGNTYYWNAKVGLTQYEKPPEFNPSTAQAQRNDANSAGGSPWGVPRSYKAFVIIVILGMKLVAVALVWVAGVGYIALSDSNQSLMLNTLVAGFVNEIDHMVFLFTTSTAMREALNTLPPARHAVDKEPKRQNQVFPAACPPASPPASPPAPPPASQLGSCYGLPPAALPALPSIVDPTRQLYAPLPRASSLVLPQSPALPALAPTPPAKRVHTRGRVQLQMVHPEPQYPAQGFAHGKVPGQAEPLPMAAQPRALTNTEKAHDAITSAIVRAITSAGKLVCSLKRLGLWKMLMLGAVAVLACLVEATFCS